MTRSAPLDNGRLDTGGSGLTSLPGTGFSGRDLYTERSLTAPDAFRPSTGSAVGVPGSIAPEGGAPGLSIPPARTQPRVRFPAPYSPAGTSVRTPVAAPRAVSPKDALPGSTGSPRTVKGAIGKRDSGPLVRYDRGPTKRVDAPKTVDAPRTVTPARATRPDASPTRGLVGKGATTKVGGTKVGGTKVGGTKVAGKRPTSVTAKGWRDVRRSDPKSARDIAHATKVFARAHDVAAGVAVGTIGGVYAGGFRGGLDLDDPWVCDPWGWNGWSSSCGSWSWGASWCWWSYPCYWSWYYPCWWFYSRPYYYTDYCYYTPVTTVVYSEPQVVYVERQSEPVGEAVIAAPAEPIRQVAPAPESPLSIAAQRYLDLGDRAFREGRYTDAVQFYAKAVEFAPDQGALYLVLADALFAAGDYHYGAYAIRRALELDPALIESQIDKHGFYQDPRLFDEQLAALERYMDDHASDRDARLVLALNYMFGGRPKDAVRVIEAAGPTMAEDQAAQNIAARARQLLKD